MAQPYSNMDQDEFVGLFAAKAEDAGKIYVPDAMDKTIANNILVFFQNHKEDQKVLERCIVLYCSKTHRIVVTIKELANNLDQYYNSAIQERDSKERFEVLLKQTQKRMTNIES